MIEKIIEKYAREYASKYMNGKYLDIREMCNYIISKTKNYDLQFGEIEETETHYMVAFLHEDNVCNLTLRKSL